MTEPLLFDRELLLIGLGALDSVLQLHREPHQALIVVGGSYLALAELRQATRDVDTVTRLTDATRRAIEEVAAELDFPPHWLNDHAASFMPVGLTVDHCATVFEGSVLKVLVPSPDWIFLMKLYAARAVDRSDMIRLWPEAGFETAEVAVTRYWTPIHMLPMTTT